MNFTPMIELSPWGPQITLGRRFGEGAGGVR
jgi:hypothetical protein